MSEVIPEAEAFIRFRLEEMSSRNEHHRFEEVATRVAQKRISSNILIATGPVSAGGDQQRDAESFRTRLPDELPHAGGFIGAATTDRVVVACTVQREGLRAKVLSDLAGICSEDANPVDHVAFFSVHPISEGHTHELQRVARESYGVHLDVFCGGDIAEFLVKPDLVWVARHYLQLPTFMVPPPESEAPEWYAQLLERLRVSGGPQVLTPGTQGPLVEALRFATWDEEANAELPEWISFMRAYLSHREADGSDSELVFRACYEIAVARFRGTGFAADIEDLVRRAIDYACSSQDQIVVDDAVTLASYWGVMWMTGAGRAEAAEIAGALRQVRDHVSALLDLTDPTTHPIRAASLTGTLAFSSLIPNYEEAEAMHGRPRATDRAPNAGVRLDETTVDTAELDAGLIDADQAMGQLESLVDLLPRARVYSVRQLAVVFDMFAPHLADHPAYMKVRDGLDAATASAEGDAATAEKCRDRGMAFMRSDEPLKALSEFHTANLKWFNGDTIYGSVLTMRYIAKVYADLGLMYAAKMYTTAAVMLSVTSADSAVRTQAPQALLETARHAQAAGTWIDAAALTEIAILAGSQLLPEGFDDEEGSELAAHETNSELELAAIRQYWPDLEPLVQDAHPTTDWYERLSEVVEMGGAEFPMSEDQLQERATEQLVGPLFGDVGECRLIDFTALGVRWTFTFDNDQATVLAAEGFVAAFQVLLADIAPHHPVIIRGVVHTTIDLEQDSASPADAIDIDDTEPEVHAHVTLPAGSADSDDRDPVVLSMCMQLLDAVHVRPHDELGELLEPLFRDGLAHKVSVGRPYEEAARLLASNHYERCAAATRPASSSIFRPTERPPLDASTRTGTGYDHATSLRLIRERYEVASSALRYTLPRILADRAGLSALRRLRAEGWLDWQILVALLNIALDFRRRAVGLPVPDTSGGASEALMALARAEETPASTHLPLDLFTSDLGFFMFMQTATVGRRWGLRGRSEAPGGHAMRDLLTRRYEYAVDDIPHTDLLDCVDEHGALVPFVDSSGSPGTAV